MIDDLKIIYVRLSHPDPLPGSDLSVVSCSEKITKDQLSLGIVQSCSVLLFLNDEVGVRDSVDADCFWFIASTP